MTLDLRRQSTSYYIKPVIDITAIVFLPKKKFSALIPVMAASVMRSQDAARLLLGCDRSFLRQSAYTSNSSVT